MKSNMHVYNTRLVLEENLSRSIYYKLHCPNAEILVGLAYMRASGTGQFCKQTPCVDCGFETEHFEVRSKLLLQ